MSQTAKLDLDSALQTLRTEVYIPTFFGTLAELGIAPKNDKQAEHLLQIAYNLMLADQAETGKQADAAGDFIEYAASQLEQHLHGSAAALPRYNEQTIKQASEQFAGNANLVAAALVIQDAALGA